MFKFKKEKVIGYINLEKPKDPESWEVWWTNRWNNLDLNYFQEMGFSMPETFLGFLRSSNDHQIRNFGNLGKSPLYIQPLDQENFKETSKLNGFLSITIGEFPHGESAVIPLSGPEGRIFLMDDLGGGDQICEIITYEAFFSSFMHAE
ncbi:MAG: hypothetical protein ABI162_11965 [Luteolibacter sp.]